MKLRVLFIISFMAAPGWAQTNDTKGLTFPKWGPIVKGGGVYHFPAHLEGGGSFSVNRYYIEAGIARMWSTNKLIAVTGGYGQDDYHFKDVPEQPWNNIDNYRLSAFAQWALGEKWTAMVAPSVRSYGEPGVDLDDALTYAVFAGATYKFSDSLSVGPGFAVIEQMRDNDLYLPILLIDWSITEKLSVNTGGGLAATTGPGLSLNYQMTDHWQAGLTGRYERKRFLLSEDSVISNGVGQDESIPLVMNLTYSFYPGGFVGVIFGYNFRGKLEVESEDGSKVRSELYHPSPMTGLVATFRF